MFGSGFISDMVARNRQNLLKLRDNSFLKVVKRYNNDDNSKNHKSSKKFYRNLHSRRRVNHTIMLIAKLILSVVIAFLLIRIIFY